MTPLLLALALLGATGGEIDGKITIAKLGVGSQVEGPQQTLVYLEDAPGDPAKLPKGPFTMAQQGKEFDPPILVVPTAATVAFPNEDRVLHNVYSGSETKRFHLGLYGGGESKSVTFDRPGIVEVFCNIHPRMAAIIVVVTNGFFTRPDASGAFTLTDVPPGTWHLVTIFPFGKSRRDEVKVSAGGKTSFSETLVELPDPRRHDREDGSKYGGY